MEKGWKLNKALNQSFVLWKKNEDNFNIYIVLHVPAKLSKF
jgi:hypothetical protein